jgi:hypothetical protein
MKLLTPLALTFLMLAGLGPAEPAGEPGDDPAEVVRQFQRDLDLIEALVEDGLNMGGEEDPIRRAQVCLRLAEKFNKELLTATASRDGARALELSTCLQGLQSRGVAGNLAVARAQPKDRIAEVEKLGSQAAKVTRQAETELLLIPPAEDKAMSDALAKIKQGRTDVEHAVQGKVQPKDKGKGKGKKAK